MRRTKEEAETTRRLLLDGALDVFSAKGYAATRLEDVARAAGVTRGAIYWHFNNKADLYAQLLQEKQEGAGRAVAALFRDRPSSALATLERLMTTFVEALERDDDYRRVLTLVWFKSEVTADLADGFDDKVRGIFDRMEQLKTLVAEAIAAGEIPAQDEDVAARAAYALMGGLMMLYLFDARLLTPSAHARAAIRLFLRGLEHPAHVSEIPPTRSQS